MLTTPVLQDFAPYRDAVFRVGESDRHELKLADLIDRSNAQLEQFSLVFTCGTLPWLPQGTYTLFHPELTEVVLFLVPIGPVGEEMRYESVFSRLLNNCK